MPHLGHLAVEISNLLQTGQLVSSLPIGLPQFKQTFISIVYHVNIVIDNRIKNEENKKSENETSVRSKNDN